MKQFGYSELWGLKSLRHSQTKPIVTKEKKMAKYDPLNEYLSKQPMATAQVVLTFQQIENIIGQNMEPAARKWLRAWDNTPDAPRQDSWLNAGWKVIMADLDTEKVGFQRIAQKASQPTRQSFTIKCPYCKGDGKLQDFIYGPRDCPVPGCIGGWLNLDGNKSDYEIDGTCKGTGKEGDEIYGWKPCHSCHGTGLIKVR
jgi:hypothetical protein